MISEEQQDKNLDLFSRLTGQIADGMPNMSVEIGSLVDMYGDEFCTAPASTRESYHNAFPGGLLDHSLRVCKNLLRLQKDLCPDRWEKEELIFVGLFHDLGKIGVDGQPRYIPNDNKFQRIEWGKIYKTNPDMPFMTIDDATLYNMQKIGITLTSEQYLALKLADGQYDRANVPYAMREPDLGVLLHFADSWATRVEKARIVENG